MYQKSITRHVRDGKPQNHAQNYCRILKKNLVFEVPQTIFI